MLRNDRLSTIVFSSQKTLVNAKSHRYISLSSSSSFFYHHLSPSTTIPHFLREFCRRWYLLLIYINVLYCFCYLSTPSSAESSTSSASEDFLVVQQKTRHQLPLSDIVNNSSSPALVGFGQTSHHIVLTDLSQPIIPQVTPPHDQKQQELLLPPPPLNFLSRNTPATTESLHLITTNSSSDTTCEKTCRAMMASTLRVEPPTYDVHRVRWKSPLGLWYCVLSVLLILFAGLASGLTLGLMSLDPVQLKVLGLEGTEEEKKGVQLVSKVIRRHHLLLVTLLLTNSIALETLPIFLDRLVPSWAAIALSVTGILLFGEIIPQAVCTGRRQLAIAQVCCCYIPFGTHSHAVPLISQTAAPYVNILIGLFFIISWPIATLLDYLVGDTEHHSYYARAHLKALIRMHEKDRRMADGTVTGGRCDSSSALGSDEVVVIEGALDLAEKTVKQIMLPIQDVFMLSSDTIMDQQSSNIVLSTGHSRVPVYSGNRNNIKGLLLTKSLLAVDSSAGITAGQLIVQRRSIFVSPNCNLYHILNEFQKGHSHIAFVTMQPEEYSYALKMTVDVNPSASLMGIVTLEDVIEELIQEEIYDEFDQTGGGLGISKPNGLLVESGALPLGYADAWYFTDINATGDSGYGRKYSSSALHTLNKTLTSEPKRASSFARDLPQVVQQLAPDVSRLTKCSGSRKYPPSCTNNPLLASMTLPLVISMDSPPIHESRKSSDTLHRMTSSPTNLIGNDYSNYSPKKKKKISTDCPNITIPVASEAEDPHIISTSNHMINGDVEYQSNPLSVKYHTANENQGLDPTTDIPETLLSTWDPNPSLQTDIFSWDTAANNPASDLLQQSLIEPTTTNPVLTSDNPTKLITSKHRKGNLKEKNQQDTTVRVVSPECLFNCDRNPVKHAQTNPSSRISC